MKSILFTMMILLSSAVISNAQQISLFDSEGEAIAYIDFDEDATIFMWDGTPVAFLEKDGRNICVIGFNGSFMGWYEDGIVYDKKGYVVGARKGAVNMLTRMERMKGMKRMLPMRPMSPMTPMQPMYRGSWSSTSLSEFLYFGKK